MGKKKRKKKTDHYREDPRKDYMIFLKYYPEQMKKAKDAKKHFLPERIKAMEKTEGQSWKNNQTKRIRVIETPENVSDMVSLISTETNKPAMFEQNKVQSMRLKIGDTVINTETASSHFRKRGIVKDIQPDRSCDWERLGVQCPPVNITIELENGNTITAHEHYWFPVER